MGEIWRKWDQRIFVKGEEDEFEVGELCEKKGCY